MKKYLEIGKRLRILRGNETQINFAKKIEATLRAYQYYEAGERVPHIHILTRIAELCGTTTDWILTGDLNIEKARIVERAKAAIYLEEIVEKLEEINRREEKLLYTGVVQEGVSYGVDRLEEKDFIQKLRGYITDVKVDFLPIETRKLVETLIEILQSGNDYAIKAVKANIEASRELIRISKNNNEDKSKGGD